MWRDVVEKVLGLFSDLFRAFEHMECFDPNSDLDIFCVQFIYLDRINECLNEFRMAWNLHPLRSETGQTPAALWMSGAYDRWSMDRLQQLTPEETAYENMSEVDLSLFGIDYDGPIVQTDNNVVVEPPALDFGVDLLESLQQLYLSTINRNDDGIDKYLALRAEMNDRLASNDQ